MEAADHKSAELERALRDASENGRWPIVFDTSPCAYRMKRYCGARLAVQDSIEFIHDTVLPRVDDHARARAGRDPSGVQRAQDGHGGQAGRASPARCSPDVIAVNDVLCCGFAGDKGFNRPELNEHALRHLKEAIPAGCTPGYSSSRTCEIGLSEQAGFPYRSIIHLVDACASARSAGRRTRRLHESSAVHPLLRGRVFPRSRNRDPRVARAAGRGGRLSAGSDLLRAADGEQRMPGRRGRDRSAVRQEFFGP